MTRPDARSTVSRYVSLSHSLTSQGSIKSVIVILLFLLLPNIVPAQTDSLADIFPLAVRNGWTYYFGSFFWSNTGHIDDLQNGTARYSIVSSTLSGDSTHWLFNRKRTYTDRSFSNYMWHTGTNSDSITFEIVEIDSGRHQLYTPQFDAWSAFPFLPQAADSLKFFRYVPVDSTGRAHVNLNQGRFYYNYFFVVQRDTGIVNLTGEYYPGDLGERDTFRLLSTFVDTIHIDTSTVDSGDGSGGGSGDTTSDAHPPSLPKQFSLGQNYPNPFNPNTTIHIELPKESHVRLELYDVLGQLVLQLLDEERAAGVYDVKVNTGKLSSEVYFYRLTADNFVQTKKMVLAK